MIRSLPLAVLKRLLQPRFVIAKSDCDAMLVHIEPREYPVVARNEFGD